MTDERLGQTGDDNTPANIAAEETGRIDHWGKEDVDKVYLEQMGISVEDINNKRGTWTEELNRLSEAGAQVIVAVKTNEEGVDRELVKKAKEKSDEVVREKYSKLKCSCMEDALRNNEIINNANDFYSSLFLFRETGLISDEQKEAIEKALDDHRLMSNVMNFGLPLKPKNGLASTIAAIPSVYYWAIKPSETPDKKTEIEK